MAEMWRPYGAQVLAAYSPSPGGWAKLWRASGAGFGEQEAWNFLAVRSAKNGLGADFYRSAYWD